MSEFVMGYRQNISTRCDFCHRPKDSVYVVKDGPTTGRFCSQQHYILARDHMEGKDEDV